MQDLLLYIAILNMVLTAITALCIYGISRFPETPSRPYYFLTGAFLIRLAAQITGVGFIDEILKSEFPSAAIIRGTIMSITMSLFFLFAYLEKYVLLKKKYGDTLKK